jgi:hypothetical protein
MAAVLLLFLLPVGGGIPAGVLLARARGLPWPLTAGLYFLSDVLLALALEPILRGLVALGKRVPFLARLGAAMQVAMARTATLVPGTGTGPLSLVMIAFGVDPMTGRAAALAAGHGFLAGWAFAIAGDMLYFGLIALATLRLNVLFRSPTLAMVAVLGIMAAWPLLVHGLRTLSSKGGPRARDARPPSPL